MTAPPTIQVAVIGAGISGLYCAYEIGKIWDDWKITVYEGTSRVGGRLESVKLKGVDAYHGDFGAMRFIPNDHPRLFQLIKDMGLESQVQDFPSPTRNTTLWYLKGKYLSHKDIEDGEIDMYPNMTTKEKIRAKSSTELQKYWNEQVLKPNQTGNVYDWEFQDGTKANSHGVLNAWHGVASPNAIEFLAQIDLHPTLLHDNSNFCDFISHDESQNKVAKFCSHKMYSEKARNHSEGQLKTLHGGMESLATAVKAKFLGSPISTPNSKHQILTEHKLLSVDVDGTKTKFILRFQRTRLPILEVYAEQVILAIPKDAIAQINFNESAKLLRDSLGLLLPAVDGQLAGKTFLVYDKKWWTDSSIIGIPKNKLPGPGEAAITQWGTDTYANTVLDLGSINTSTTDNHVLILYHEWDHCGEFWRSLADPNGDRHKVTDAHKSAARKILAELFSVADISKIPPEKDAKCVAWRDGPYYAGWHSTNGQFNYPKVMDDIQRPVSGFKLYVVGEAYSDVQGWIEGALKTSDCVLTKNFRKFNQ